MAEERRPHTDHDLPGRGRPGAPPPRPGVAPDQELPDTPETDTDTDTDETDTDETDDAAPKH